jgi:hypothetical protein
MASAVVCTCACASMMTVSPLSTPIPALAERRIVFTSRVRPVTNDERSRSAFPVRTRQDGTNVLPVVVGAVDNALIRHCRCCPASSEIE